MRYNQFLVWFLVYDDYKFVSTGELHSLGLAHMIGSNMLRAYMHGYFLDIRLYYKVMMMDLYILSVLFNGHNYIMNMFLIFCIVKWLSSI